MTTGFQPETAAAQQSEKENPPDGQEKYCNWLQISRQQKLSRGSPAALLSACCSLPIKKTGSFMVSTATVTSGGKLNILTERGKKEMNGVIYRTGTEIHGRHADRHYFKRTHHILIWFKKQKDNSHVIAKKCKHLSMNHTIGNDVRRTRKRTKPNTDDYLRFGLFKLRW